MDSKRITVFAGHYGSGKTNIAVNYALKLREKYDKVNIADLDIVNPYFRSKDSEKYLEEKGIQYKDYGTYTEDSCNYATYGHLLAEGVENGEVYPGIAMCGSGEGISMTLNKHQGVRAGLCWMPEIAHLIRQHNDANVLVMPGRFIDNDTARAIMDEFFQTPFEGGRHMERIADIPLKK